MLIQERVRIMVTEATIPGCTTKLHINCKLKSDWLISMLYLVESHSPYRDLHINTTEWSSFPLSSGKRIILIPFEWSSNVPECSLSDCQKSRRPQSSKPRFANPGFPLNPWLMTNPSFRHGQLNEIMHLICFPSLSYSQKAIL